MCAQVCYFGQGDGTWLIGKPGFIFLLEIVFDDGSKEIIVSDESWLSHLARSWKPDQYKRWYLRALQEEFDARNLVSDEQTELSHDFYGYNWAFPHRSDQYENVHCVTRPRNTSFPDLFFGYKETTFCNI